jgi:hypothetical protein
VLQAKVASAAQAKALFSIEALHQHQQPAATASSVLQAIVAAAAAQVKASLSMEALHRHQQLAATASSGLQAIVAAAAQAKALLNMAAVHQHQHQQPAAQAAARSHSSKVKRRDTTEAATTMAPKAASVLAARRLGALVHRNQRCSQQQCQQHSNAYH